MTSCPCNLSAKMGPGDSNWPTLKYKHKKITQLTSDTCLVILEAEWVESHLLCLSRTLLDILLLAELVRLFAQSQTFTSLKRLIQPPRMFTTQFSQAQDSQERQSRILQAFINIASCCLKKCSCKQWQLNAPSHRTSYARRSLPQVPSICNSFCTWKNFVCEGCLTQNYCIYMYIRVVPSIHSIINFSVSSR